MRATIVVEADLLYDGSYSRDITSDVMSAQLSLGRGKEFSDADPGKLSLELNNRDGSYTPISSGYFPGLKVRIRSTSPVSKTLFTGYVQQASVDPGHDQQSVKLEISDSYELVRKKIISLGMMRDEFTGTIINRILDMAEGELCDYPWPSDDTTGWAVDGTATMARVTTGKLLHDPGALQVTSVAAADGVKYTFFNWRTDLRGKKCTVAAYVRPETDADIGDLVNVLMKDSTGTIAGSPTTFLAAGRWTRIEVTGTWSTTGTSRGIYVERGAAAGAANFRIGAVHMCLSDNAIPRDIDLGDTKISYYGPFQAPVGQCIDEIRDNELGGLFFFDGSGTAVFEQRTHRMATSVSSVTLEDPTGLISLEYEEDYDDLIGKVEITYGSLEIGADSTFVWNLELTHSKLISGYTSGTSTGSNAERTFNDTGKSWGTNGLVGKLVEIVSGTGAGQVREVLKNTATQVTITTPWETIPDNTSTYRISGPVKVYAPFGFLVKDIVRIGSPLALEPNYDWRANSQADGTGTDQTSNIVMTTELYGEGLVINLWNRSTSDIWITQLAVRGTPIRQSSDLPTEQYIPRDAQAASNSLTYDYLWNDNEAAISRWAKYLAYLFSRRRGRFQVTLRSANSTILTQQLSREISDRVSIRNTVKPYASAVEGDFFIEKITQRIKKGAFLHDTIWELTPVDEGIVNLVENPGSETDLTGITGTGMTVTRSTTVSRFGSYSVRCEGSAGSTDKIEWFKRDSSKIPVTGGKYYTFSLYMMPKATIQGHIGVRWYDSIGSEIGHAWGYNYAGLVWGTGSGVLGLSSSNVWVRYSVTAKSPDNATHVVPNFEETGYSMSAGEYIYMDGVMFSEGPLKPYVDGNQEGCVWDGTAEQSTSRRVGNFWVLEDSTYGVLGSTTKVGP